MKLDEGDDGVEFDQVELVLRLHWESRFYLAVVSPSLLRDYLFGRPLPQPPTDITFRLFDIHPIHFTIISIKKQFKCSTETKKAATITVHIIPPHPPWLLSLCNASNSTTTKSSISTLLPHLLRTHTSICLPNPPRVILVQSPRESGKTTTISNAVHSSNATLIRVTPSYLLPHASSSKALCDRLKSLVLAACATAPSCLFLDDVHFMFPPDADRLAVALPPVIDMLRTATAHVILVMASSGDLHRSAHSCVDVVTTIENKVTIEDNMNLGLNKGLYDYERVEEKWNVVSNELPGTIHALRILKRILRPHRHGQKTKKAKRITGFRLPRAALLYGVPGTGKTALVKGAADAAGYEINAVDAAQLAHGEVGESEIRLKQAFSCCKSNEIIFFDEVDTLFSSSEGASGTRLITTLARCMDEYLNVRVIAATNRPWRITKMLRRPGRFDYCVRIGVPGKDERKRIMSVYATKMDAHNDVVKRMEELGAMDRMQGVTGADLGGVCRRAAMTCLWRGNYAVEVEDVDEAFEGMCRSVSVEEMRKIDWWDND